MNFPHTQALGSHTVRAGVLALFTLAASHTALAANISLSGNFQQDDKVQTFTLTLGGAGTLSVSSIGYAGGAPFGGLPVGAGGFDSVLYLFSNTGALLYQSDDGVAAPVDPATGQGLDAAFTTASLAAGQYTLALTQADNYLLGFNLSDGFGQADTGNFTVKYGCSNAAFCDFTGSNRTSAWALNFSGQTLDAVVPEPSSMALVLAAAGAALVLRRSRRDSAEGAGRPTAASA